MQIRLTHIIVMICIIISATSQAWSQQILIDRISTPEPNVFRPVTPDEMNKVTISEQHADIVIREQAATITIEQVFHSTFQSITEGTFIFPIPDDAALSQFSMWMGGKEVSGQVLESGEARRIYEGIVSRMRDPGLLEYVGSKMFKARVFPIPANGDMKIKLTYTQVLPAESGLVTLTYPLNCSKFTKEPLRNVTLSIDIQDQTGIRTVFSPSHNGDLAISKIDDHHVRASYEQANYLPNKDFLLYYSKTEKDYGLNMISHRSMGDDGYFTMMISPRTDIRQEDIAAKDVVFVLDTSGSMKEEGGLKLRQAKQALHASINHLNVGDRYNILAFNMDVRSFKESLIEVNKESRIWGKQFVDGLNAGGGTNVNDALLAAIAMQDNPSRLFMVCFITDGTPTIGERDHAKILDNVKRANTANSRIFVFGVGSDLNAVLLDKIAEYNNGSRTYVNANDDMETRISEFATKVAYPVMANLKLTVQGVETYSIYPSTLPDLFKGSQIIISGRYKGEGSNAITLTGELNGNTLEFVYEANFPNDRTGNDHVPLLWATKRVGALLDEIRFQGHNDELVKEIVSLGKEYGIVTPYTSYLVVEEGELSNLENRRDRLGRMAGDPLGNPEGAMPGIELREELKSLDLENEPAADSHDDAQAYMDMDESADGIALSQAVEKLKKGDIDTGRGGFNKNNDSSRHWAAIQRAGGKTFYFRQGVYVDSDVTPKDMKSIVKVKFMSDDYLKLLTKTKKMKLYFAIDSFLILKVADTVYFIYDAPDVVPIQEENQEAGE